jgi:hypothetical protein
MNNDWRKLAQDKKRRKEKQYKFGEWPHDEIAATAKPALTEAEKLAKRKTTRIKPAEKSPTVKAVNEILDEVKSTMTPQQIRDKIREVKMKHGVKTLIVDTLTPQLKAAAEQIVAPPQTLPDWLIAGDLLSELLDEMNDLTTSQLLGHITAERYVEKMFAIVDGPQKRAAQRLWHRAREEYKRGNH